MTETHIHQWITTGVYDTGHQPPRAEYKCKTCPETAWSNNPDGPATGAPPPPALVEVLVDGLLFHHLDHYTEGTGYPTFAEAVAAAREHQKPFDWGGHTRETIELRTKVRSAPQSTDHRHGSEHGLMRWEVFPDRVVQIPAGQGGLTEEQGDAAMTLNAESLGVTFA